MLVISRTIGEVIRIGEDITVMVIKLESGKVRLGIEAPDDVSIHRGEIYNQIHQERLAKE